MKELIATVLAVGALGGVTAAMAEPAVVASAGTTIYTDSYGRQYSLDPYGRQVFIQTAPQTIVGYDQWGRAIYGSAPTYVAPQTYAYVTPPVVTYNYSYNRRDRDGDGVANWNDRYPNDPRWR